MVLDNTVVDDVTKDHVQLLKVLGLREFKARLWLQKDCYLRMLLQQAYLTNRLFEKRQYLKAATKPGTFTISGLSTILLSMAWIFESK